MKKTIVDNWNFIMNHDKNPLKNIPDTNTRHMIMQILAWMWCIIFTMMTGTWMYLGVNVLFHTLLLGGITLTVAVFETAKRKPEYFRGEE